MAISEDTAALVAAQLTVAWATRIGTEIQKAYTIFLKHVSPEEPDIDSYIASHKER